MIPLSERDTYFLLGDPGRSDFLRFLSAKRRVKLSIVGTHDRKLKVEGPADRVEQIKIDWAAHQASIKTASIPDPAVPSLKKDLLRPLSLATGSLVQQHERKRTLNVTYREGEQHGLDRVRLLVERLARQVRELLTRSLKAKWRGSILNRIHLTLEFDTTGENRFQYSANSRKAYLRL